MSEAPKLDPDLGLESHGKSPKDRASAQPGLDPVLVEQAATLTGESQALTANDKEPDTEDLQQYLVAPRRESFFLERMSNALMFLFVSGTIAFLAGVVIAATIFLGLLDLHTTWVKELLHTLKELAKAASGGSGPSDP